MHVLRMWHVLVTHVLANTNGVDDQRTSIPMSYGVAIETGLDIINGFLRTIEKYAANLSVSFLNDRDLTLALQNLQWEWSAHHSRHTVGQACDDAFGNRLS